MTRADPFTGYSMLLRLIVYGVVPAFMLFQGVRARRALHVFQLEGYKRRRFIGWVRANRRRALFLARQTHKKPLVMTGRAWRIYVTALALQLAALLGLPGAVHVWAGGAPGDLAVWAAVTLASFWGLPLVLVAADALLEPVQGAINARYARAARRRLAEVGPVVIGVTGSFGKTSTKFAVAGLLADDGDVLATPGSFNTPMGVCRTINEALDDRHRFFVVEMGAYGEGEIAELCRFVRPSAGVLTAIGPAHLERFGSIDAIARAKYELIQSLPDGGLAVMNVDDPRVRDLAGRTRGRRVVRYGLDPAGDPDVTAFDIEITPSGTTLTLVAPGLNPPPRVTTRLLGRHAVGHVLAGTAVAAAYGVGADEIADRAARLEPVPHRLQLIEGAGGVTVIDDAFNSNPEGAAAALEVLAAMPARRRVVVTPGIVELGDLQRSANVEFGRRAAEVADTVVIVAPLNRDALSTGAAAAGGAEVIVVDDLDEATAALARIVAAGDVVLFENDLPDQYER